MATVAKLNVQIGATIKGLEGALKNAESGLNKFAKNATAIGATLTKSLTLPLVGFATASVFAFDKQAKAVAQVEQAIVSTGGAANRTSKELQDMASSLQKNSLFGDEEILQKVTAQLLTFTNIAGTAFDRTQQAALDLASRLGGDLQSASIQLGKALNDPVANLSALSRSGIQFSEDQKALIDSLVKTNRLADAQTVILDELEKQYGGSAKAAAIAGAGGITQLKMSFGDLMEAIGKVVVEAINPFVKRLKEIVEELQKTDKETLKFFITLGAFAAAIGPVLIGLGLMAKGLVAVKALLLFTYANPYVLVTAGVVALIGHYAILISRVNRTNKLLNAPFDETLPINDQLDIAIQRLKALDERFTKLKKNEGIGTTSEFGLIAQQGQIANAKKLLDLERDRVAKLIKQNNAINKNADSSNANNEIISETLTTIKSINDELESNQQKIDAILNINGSLTDQQMLELVTLTSINDSLTDQIKQREELVRLAIAERNANIGQNTENPFKPIVGMNIQDDIIYPFKQVNFELMNLDQLMSKNLDNFEQLETVPLNLSSNFEILQPIIDNFVNSFGAGMANVVLQGEKLQDVLKNIGKLLLSSAIQFAISALLNGGVGTGTGFFGSSKGLLGTIFGGATPVKDALIQSNGNIVKFHPNDNILAMKDFSGLGGGGGGSVSAIRVSVDTIRVSGSDILIALKNTERAYG